MAKKDYYETLGVSKTATDAEIKSAFRKMAKQYHPDVNKEPGAAEKFKEISEAYSVLSDENKRKIYDQYGADAVNNAGQGGAGGFGDFGGFQGGFGDFSGFSFGQDDLEDIISSFFGGRSSKSRKASATKGEDLLDSPAPVSQARHPSGEDGRYCHHAFRLQAHALRDLHQ